MTAPIVRLLPALLLSLTGCTGDPVACPAYKAFDGVYLDYRDVDLPGNITGRICVDDDCRSLQQWNDLGGGQGRVNLALDQERQNVQLDVKLLSDRQGQAVQVDRRVELLAVYNANRDCGVYGYSRAVTINADGQFDLGGATPER